MTLLYIERLLKQKNCLCQRHGQAYYYYCWQLQAAVWVLSALKYIKPMTGDWSVWSSVSASVSRVTARSDTPICRTDMSADKKSRADISARINISIHADMSVADFLSLSQSRRKPRRSAAPTQFCRPAVIATYLALLKVSFYCCSTNVELLIDDVCKCSNISYT